MAIILIILFIGSCKKTDPKLSSNWSEYQGRIYWYKLGEAKAKCVNIGRLPTMLELRLAYQANVTESWKKDGLSYWSSDYTSSDSGNFPHIFNVGNGNSDNNPNYPSEGIHVRCIR